VASSVDICNLALKFVNKSPITSLSSSSPSVEERACRAVYDEMRESLLRLHPWGFATRQQALAPLTSAEEITGWDYVYAYPSDCLLARFIYDPSGSDNQGIPFREFSSSDLSSRIIVTNQDDAKLVYTADVDNANVFDSLFVIAFARLLASELAMSLKGGRALSQYNKALFQSELAAAGTADSNESEREPITGYNPYVRARG